MKQFRFIEAGNNNNNRKMLFQAVGFNKEDVVFNRKIYFPSKSNSRFTGAPTFKNSRFVCCQVYGIIATVNVLSVTRKAVRLMPFTQMDPFSITSWAKA